MDELTRVIIVFLLGIVSGIGLHKYAPKELERFKPSMTEEEIKTMGDYFRSESKTLERMAEVADRLAAGDDPDHIIESLDPELRRRWEKYDIEN